MISNLGNTDVMTNPAYMSKGPVTQRRSPKRKNQFIYSNPAAESEAPYSKMSTTPTNPGLGTVSHGASTYNLPMGTTDTLENYLSQSYSESREKYDTFIKSLMSGRYGEELVEEVRPTMESEAEKQRGITARNLARYGQSLTPAERMALQRQEQRSEALSLAGALTNTRVAARDIQQNYLRGLANLGVAIRGEGLTAALGAEASTEAGRQALSANRSAYKSNIASTLGTAATIWAFGGF